ncbi:CBL-interacting serine/threonine-protein kinase 14-like [Lotus japonicus]|uniref:CBL-interacting serine/threonine-protein kinase 14-like n=1 Tax=Lotus japonicus TaxID=34305 RepID=UPI0025896DFF|nr:CBL-interacting serine/threonine-protein kinase 14-like [Lotus japonicus]
MRDAQNDTVSPEKTETTNTDLPNDVVLFGNYHLQNLLGVGASAKVYHALNVDTGQSVAVKVVSKRKLVAGGGGSAASIEREITIMRRLNHQNIIELFEVLATKTKIYFIMEFAAGGELFHAVEGKGRLDEPLARKYFRQLISAVKHCHSRGVFHRDLKLDNLLLDGNGDLKVTDFGLSAVKSQIRSDGLLHTACGTPSFVAPEILAKRGYDGATVDVWSCGVVLFALTAGYLPFNDYNMTVLYRKIYRGQFRFPRWTSPDLKNLLSRMLDRSHETRITIDEILEDPWFIAGGYIPDPVLVKEKQCEDAQTGVDCLNAFDLISFSTGLDMSGMFVDPIGSDSVERVVSEAAAEGVVERVVAAAREAGLVVKRKENEVKLEGHDDNLIALVVVYRLTDELVVVEMKRREKGCECGCKFWKDKLRPLLFELARKQEVPVTR